MTTLREALRTAGVVGVLGSAVVAATLLLSRYAGAQPTVRAPRAGFTLLASNTAPSSLSSMIAVDADSLPLSTLLQDIAHRAKVGIAYDRSLPGLGQRVTMHATGSTAAAAVLRALDGTSIDALVSPSGQIVLVRHAARAGQVRGIVLDSSGTPVPNAFLELGASRLVAVTATDGSFAFQRVLPGEHALMVRRLGFRPATTTIHLTDGDMSVEPIVVTLEPTPVPLTAVVVSPGYFGIMAQQIGAPQTLDREEIRTRPQLGDDLFRSINRLPGLTSDDFSAGFHVRGSQVDEMYVTLDGVQLFEPFHLKDMGGALSILDVGSVDGVDLTTGGFTTEYGGRLGSLLSIRSLEPATNAPRTTIGLSVTNLRVQSEGGFGDGRGSWLVAARRGYLDLALKLAGATDSISPVYSDVFAKTSWTINDGNRLALHLLDAEDGLHYTDRDGRIRSVYASRYAWLTWDTRLGDRLSGESVWSASGLTWSRVGVPSFKVNDEVHDHRAFHDVAARTDFTLALWNPVVLKFGGEARSQHATYDYTGVRLVTTSSGGKFEQTPQTIVANVAPAGSTLAGYVAPRISIGERLTAEAGVRLDRASYSHDGLVSPRANVVVNLTSSTSIRASLGRYDQPQPIYALQVGDGVTSFAPADLSTQTAVSVEQRTAGGVSVRIEAYDRDIAREHARYINLRQSTEVFPEFPPDRTLLPATSGRARGIELMTRRQAISGFDWTASYALASITDDIGGVRVPRMFDQRHTLYVDGSYHPADARWRLSAAWQIHSGWPQPPVSFAVDTVRPGPSPGINITPVYGPLTALGAQRLPWYRRFDLRYTRDVVTSRGRLSFFADIFNVFNAKNPRFDDYNFSLRNGAVDVRPVPNSQVGRLPSAGISWEF